MCLFVCVCVCIISHVYPGCDPGSISVPNLQIVPMATDSENWCVYTDCVRVECFPAAAFASPMLAVAGRSLGALRKAGGGDKAVVFSQFTSFLDIVQVRQVSLSCSCSCSCRAGEAGCLSGSSSGPRARPAWDPLWQPCRDRLLGQSQEVLRYSG